MKTRKFKAVMYVMLCIAVVFALGLMAGCKGSDGSNGINGSNGAPGSPGTPGVSAASAFGKHSVNQGMVVPTVTISSVSNASGFPKVSFHVQTASGPYATLTSAQVGAKIADLLETGATGNFVSAATGSTYSTDYFEMWASETPAQVAHPACAAGTKLNSTTNTCVTDPNNGPGSYATPATAAIDTSDAANGNYSYTFTTPWGGAWPGYNNLDYAAANKKRVMITIKSDNAVILNGVAFQDISGQPASGSAGTVIDSQRQFVTIQACQKCHTQFMDNAAHASTYLDTRGCDFCHSPLYASAPRHAVGFMDRDDAILPVFIHQIHGQHYTNPAALVANDTVYPQEINNCASCHTNSGLSLGTGDMIDNWETHPTARVCSSCHTGNTLGADGVSMKHDPAFQVAPYSAPSTTVTDSACIGCHDGAIAGYHDITLPTFVAPPTGTVTSLPTPSTPEYNVAIAVSGATGTGFFQAGDTPTVTITLTNSDGSALPGTFNASVGHAPGYYDPNGLSIANMYVYGPRPSPRPSFLPTNRTDKGAAASTTSVNLLGTYYSASRTSGVPPAGPNTYVDPNNAPTATGWTYTLAPIPAGTLPGTYFVRVYLSNTYTENIADGGAGTVPDQIVSVGLVQFQVGTATVDQRIAGEASNGPASCVKCHGDTVMHRDDHAAKFDTDNCNACHYIGAFGNTAGTKLSSYGDPIANRVHAVHSASNTGDLHGNSWTDINYPSNIERCAVCHNSGNTSYLTNLYEIPCYGCHADVTGAAAHMNSMGGSLTSIVSVSTSTVTVPESCDVCHSPGKDVDISAAP